MASMTQSTRIAAAMAGLLLAGLATEAEAATVTYNFTANTTAYSLTKNFTAIGGPNLTVSANTVSTDGSIVTPVTGSGNGVGQWAGLGLGLKNSSSDNSHTVDGSGLNDLLVLAFASSVKIVSATFTYAGLVSHSDDDFAFFASPNNDGSVAGNMIFSSEEIAGSGGTGSYNFTTDAFGDFTSRIFGIGAIWDAIYQNCIRYRYGQCKSWESYTKFDSFKLASVTVETGPFDVPTEAPLPAGIILLLSSLTGLGFLKRFKSKAPA
jgi:hypothetical protein